MNQCAGSSFQDLTMADLLFTLIVIGAFVLISICILLMVKFVFKFIFLKIQWLCSKKYRYYLSILKTRENYTNKQFIQDCQTQGIDPFVGKVFWNFCYRYYPYKPHLDDDLAILYQTTFDAVIRDTMKISCYKEDFDYSKAHNVKDVLLLLSS